MTTTLRIRTKLFFAVLTSLMVVSMALGQARQGKQIENVQPEITGEQIARMTKPYILERPIKRQVGRQTVTFTPASVTESDLEKGTIIGKLDTQLKGGKTGLPPGSYHIYVAKARGGWKAYAESNGRIVGQTSDVAVTSGSPVNAAARVAMPVGPQLEADPQQIKVTVEVECKGKGKGCTIKVVIVF